MLAYLNFDEVEIKSGRSICGYADMKKFIELIELVCLWATWVIWALNSKCHMVQARTER